MLSNIIKNHYWKKDIVLDIVAYVFFISLIVFGLLIINLFATKEPFTVVENFLYYLSLTLIFVSGAIGTLISKKQHQ